MKHLFTCTAISLLLMLISGCASYKLGSLGHPQLETVAVGEIRNDSREPYAATYLKQKLPAEFMNDGSLKVVSSSSADATVHARIVNTTLYGKGGSEIEEGEEQVFRSTIFGLRVDVAYQVTRRGRDTPLLTERTISAEATFTEELDQTVARRLALEAALSEAAARIVQGVTEAW